MDIKVDHISKAYGEQQVLQDLPVFFPEGKNHLYQKEDPDVAKQH
mgnify:CR=1 FL=1